MQHSNSAHRLLISGLRNQKSFVNFRQLEHTTIDNIDFDAKHEPRKKTALKIRRNMISCSSARPFQQP